MDDDFVLFKVDMKNAFNLVSRQSILEECATFLPRVTPMGLLQLWVPGPSVMAPTW